VQVSIVSYNFSHASAVSSDYIY